MANDTVNASASYKKTQLVSIQELVHKSKVDILNLFHEYQLNEESLLSDVKKVILHCTITKLISIISPTETLVLIDLQWDCDPDIAFVIGESKCKKSIAYMLNNLKKIFKHRLIKLNEMPTALSGEVLDAVLRVKSFNFKALNLFLEKNSLSKLTYLVKEDLSVKLKIYNNF